MLLSDDRKQVIGYKQSIQAVFVESAANEGVSLLNDMRAITDSGPAKTFSFAQNYFNYESYVVFYSQLIQNVVLALVSVGIVIFFVTGNLHITAMILTCVILVDLFLFGLLNFWNVTMNTITIVNIVIAIGLAVDYSAHIGHSFLQANPPAKDENG
mgnify:CR=1 FL=1